ncbi:TLK protein kinase [Sphaeroforma arctica JP610]|uniref:TLK protein kinase n=1 Tax=Sphaeroforma arctica JP610 TaxID=667725 RepID=A0A0L0G319_9EUKA|nr:TLK protein kinase [Sphaeroforma arctica JP610]KNC83527.1 TLK protein kinase [Sphaeroforma arctica JP610]|eukprot:XP_014157429.1 TLK protein kinase [Sphaeroforma arctica JP610]
MSPSVLTNCTSEVYARQLMTSQVDENTVVEDNPLQERSRQPQLDVQRSTTNVFTKVGAEVGTEASNSEDSGIRPCQAPTATQLHQPRTEESNSGSTPMNCANESVNNTDSSVKRSSNTGCCERTCTSAKKLRVDEKDSNSQKYATLRAGPVRALQRISSAKKSSPAKSKNSSIKSYFSTKATKYENGLPAPEVAASTRERHTPLRLNVKADHCKANSRTTAQPVPESCGAKTRPALHPITPEGKLPPCRQTAPSSCPKLGSGATPSSTAIQHPLHSSSLGGSAMEINVKGLQDELKEARDLQKYLAGKLETSRMNERAINNKFDKSKHMLVKLFRDDVIQRRKRIREITEANNLRLGSYQPRRHGHDFVEAWVDGTAAKDMMKRLDEIRKGRVALEEEFRQLQAAKDATERNSSDTSFDSQHENEENVDMNMNSNTTNSKEQVGSKTTKSEFAVPCRTGNLQTQCTRDNDEAFHRKKEILHIRGDNLNMKQQILNSEHKQLEKERNLHSRQIKRIRDEDKSVYKNCPLLHNRYLLLELLGKGGFSEVYKAFDLDEMRYVACKIHSLVSQWSEEKKYNYSRHATREYEIHKELKHPNIVQLYDKFVIKEDTFCTVLEFCDGNDLDFHLKQRPALPEREAKSIIVQLFDALQYLNELEPRVVHYDLKPANLMYCNGVVKITDFGLSKIMEAQMSDDSEMELTSQFAGTYWYLPPEVFVTGHFTPRINSKVDVWSAGCIFYQMLYGKRPFGHELSQQKILREQVILKARQVEFPKRDISQDTKLTRAVTPVDRFRGFQLSAE